MSYSSNGFSAGGNLALGIGSAILFGVAVTNCIVYSGGTGSGSATSGSGGVNTNIDSTCSWIMLVLNIIFAIITFIYMIMFFLKAFRIYRANASREYTEYIERPRPRYEEYGSPNPEYQVARVAQPVPVAVPVASPVFVPAANTSYVEPGYSRVSSTTISRRSS